MKTLPNVLRIIPQGSRLGRDLSKCSDPVDSWVFSLGWLSRWLPRLEPSVFSVLLKNGNKRCSPHTDNMASLEAPKNCCNSHLHKSLFAPEEQPKCISLELTRSSLGFHLSCIFIVCIHFVLTTDIIRTDHTSIFLIRNMRFFGGFFNFLIEDLGI